MIEKITIENTERGLFFVQCGGKFAAHLTKDEVLGVVASALFSPSGPIFLRSYEEEVALKLYARRDGLSARAKAGVAFVPGPGGGGRISKAQGGCELESPL